MNNNDIRTEFSICVPTFNRGARVLRMVKQLLPDIDKNWEILVLDNTSFEEIDSYNELAELAKDEPCLKYIRHEINGLFHANFLACFEYSNAPYIMVISDEDVANPDMIRKILPGLRAIPNLGIIRGSIMSGEGVGLGNSRSYEDESFFAGEEALRKFSFVNSYFSGIIYNRDLIISYGLIETLKQGLDLNRIYPHMYMDLLVAAKCDVLTTTEVSCFEGEAQVLHGVDQPFHYSPYSFGNRVNQFFIFRDAIREAVSLVREPFDHSLFVSVYLRLCEKYFHLLARVNSPMYMQNNIHPGILLQSFLHIAGAAISMYPELQNNDIEIYERLRTIHAYHEKEMMEKLEKLENSI